MKTPNEHRGPPDGGGPPDDGGPPNGNGGPPRCSSGQGPPGPRGPPGPVRPVIVQQPQVILDTTSLENTFDTMGQSMLQLAGVQDQMNHHLQQHIQQGQLNIKPMLVFCNNWLIQLINGTMIISLQAYRYMMEAIGKNFFHG